MTAARRPMHPDEVHVDVAIVRRLLATQFPEWASRPIEPVPFFGTDNAIYRLGDDLAARLPRRERNVVSLRKERRWLPVLAPHLPLAVPVPVAAGRPDGGYPFEWAVYRWLEGEPATADRIDDVAQAAKDVAALVAALHRLDATEGPPPGEHNVFRGEPLLRRDDATRRAIEKLRGQIDATEVTARWEQALGAPEWRRRPVWIHGDLDARNMLARNGRLAAVIDFGTLGVGDPACDAMVAWKMLPAGARAVFRDALSLDDALWARARGWALSQAVIALAYYTIETNPVLVREARRWLAEVLADRA